MRARIFWGIALFVILGLAVLIFPDIEPNNPARTLEVEGEKLRVVLPLFRPTPPSPDHLRVLVTRLDGDEDEIASNRVLRAISREAVFEPIYLRQVIRIPKSGTDEAAMHEAMKNAAVLASEWNANVVVYGERDMIEGTVDLGVYSGGRTTKLAAYALKNNTLKLPDDLLDYLASAVVASILDKSVSTMGKNQLVTEAEIQSARELDGILRAQQHKISPELRQQLLVQLGYLNVSIGANSGDITWFEKALEEFKESLADQKAYPPESQQLSINDWFDATGGYAWALDKLGDMKGDANLMNSAVADFRLLLKYVSRDQTPALYAQTEANLGHSLGDLAFAKHDASLLQEANDAFDVAASNYRSIGQTDDFNAVLSDMLNAYSRFRGPGKPTCILFLYPWTLYPAIDQELHWNSCCADSGRIDNRVGFLPGPSGYFTAYKVMPGTKFTGTFENSRTKQTVQCSVTAAAARDQNHMSN